MAKKYYWLKLKDHFFTSKEIKKLRRIAGGDTYTIIYLKLMLLSLKDEGRLYYDGIEETFCEELALDLDEDPENVKVTIGFLKRMGLFEEMSSSEAFLTQVPEAIGKETDKAEIMRKMRERQRLSGNNVTKALPDRYPEIDIDIDKDIEKRKRFTPPTVDDVRSYIREKGYQVDAEAFVDFYTSKGWKVGRDSMKDWKAAVRTWARRDAPKPVKTAPTMLHDYDLKELARRAKE